MIFAVALAVTLAATSPENTFKLPGLWESAETSLGGIGQAIEFRKDGTFTESTVVLVDIPYRLDGKRLVLGKENEKGGAFTFAFEGTTLVETGPDGTVVRKERLPGQEAGPSPIVGAWRYCHYTGVIAWERYTEAGSMQLRLPMRFVTGRYSLQGNALTLSFPNGADVAISLEARGDNLAMTRSRGTTEYRRAGDRAWYDIGSVEKCNAAPPGTPATPPTPKPTPTGK
jgi:hypothetical protein